ncbi:hypothetical protein FB45DRAFT_931216 [Roridomyces roridus]|uniref:Uncharacterized protein n=1 Tax=Roridomyces roridus TaxID=1738132 RepID=A0AAD7FH30_9AGAR|nr:hypothetical protein FB45DRAFT_931216 [Roridomyces roridus]
MADRRAEPRVINIYGGTGGSGGFGRTRGGRGGTGEGPTVNFYDFNGTLVTENSRNLGRESDFRRVNLGDLILRKEIDKTTTLRYRRDHTGDVVRTRRAHHGRIFGHQEDPMTVIVYDNDIFEENLAGILKAQKYRHPCLAQLFGLTRSSGLNALIFHDEMLTLDQVEAMYSHSVLASRYILCEMKRQYNSASEFWRDTTGDYLHYADGSAWISSSTGQLCCNIGDGGGMLWILVWLRGMGKCVPDSWLSTSVTHPGPGKATEEELFRGLTHDQLFTILPHTFEQRLNFQKVIKFPSMSMWRGYLRYTCPQGIAFLNPLSIDDCDVRTWKYNLAPATTISSGTSGWTRVEEYPQGMRSLWSTMTVTLSDYKADIVKKWWLSGECTVRSSAIGTAKEPFSLGLVTGVEFTCTMSAGWDPFTLRGTFMADSASHPVYLFLFTPPVEILQGQFALTNPPDNDKYYWATDLEGRDRLTHETAEEIGLAKPYFDMYLRGFKLETDDIKLLRDFTIAKGCHPDGLDGVLAIPRVGAREEMGNKLFIEEIMGIDTDDISMPGGWPEVAEY